MKNAVFWDIKTQFVPHRRHITPPLQSPTGLCYVIFEDFHGGDYEECRLLGYKNPILTSKEAYDFSVTEPSRLMLCKI
jgi:hypothetical protein